MNRGFFDQTFNEWAFYRNSLTEHTNVINGATKITGALTIANHSTAIGTVSNSNSTTAVSVASATWTDTNSLVTVTAGVYVISCSLAFGAATAKRRAVRLVCSTDGGSSYSVLYNSYAYVGGSTTSQVIHVHTSGIASSTTSSGLKIKLQAYQDTGATVYVTSSYLRVVRIA